MKNIIKISLGLVLALVGFQAHALVISGDITNAACLADPACYLGPANSPSNPSIADMEALIAAQGGGTVDLGTEAVYKENVGDGYDSGAMAGSYSTTFSNTAADPEDATITWGGPGVIDCPVCFLLVKDGNMDPSWYLFDLDVLGWDSKETIEMVDFWVGNGAISHVSIFGGEGDNVPEPSIAALLGIGLLGMIVARRRTKV